MRNYSHKLIKATNCRSSVRQRRNPKETADLTSIQDLIDEIESKCHSGKFLIKCIAYSEAICHDVDVEDTSC